MQVLVSIFLTDKAVSDYMYLLLHRYGELIL